MSHDQTFYILPVTGGGYCAEPRSSVLETQPVGSDKQDEQGWIFEIGETGSKVAIRNAASGQYLKAQNGNDYGNVGLGEKQWWEVSRSHAVPNGFYIKCTDHGGKAVLCNGYGKSEVKGNKIFMWQSNIDGWGNRMLWYFVDAGKWANGLDTPLSITELQTSSVGKEQDNKGMTQKSAALEAAQKDLESREQALAKSLAKLQQSQEDFERQEKRLTVDRSQLEKSQQDIDAGRKSIAAGQKALAERQKLVEEKEKAVAKKGTKTTPSKEAGNELEEMRRQVEAVQAENEQLKKTRASPGNAVERVKDLERQIADLRQNEQTKWQDGGIQSTQVADLQRQLADVKRQNEQLRRTLGTSEGGPPVLSRPAVLKNDTVAQDADDFLLQVRREMSRPMTSPTPSLVSTSRPLNSTLVPNTSQRQTGSTEFPTSKDFQLRIRKELSRPVNLQLRRLPPVINPREGLDEVPSLSIQKLHPMPSEFNLRPEAFGRRPRAFDKRPMGRLEVQQGFSSLPRLVQQK